MYTVHRYSSIILFIIILCCIINQGKLQEENISGLIDAVRMFPVEKPS